MAYANQAFEYRKQAVNGASPVGLVVILYDAAIRFMEAGKAAILKKDLDSQNRELQKAQKIVFHLMATLDMDRGEHISSNLLSLYNYVIEQLVHANVHDETEPIDNALKVFVELRSGWIALDEMTKQQQDREQLVAA
ncbi:MAG TPA: flagellar export chaperone FliS [Fimbriimonas sp.]|nr:flagellar export chaperone FliS [Fimbriimonas sp.]